MILRLVGLIAPFPLAFLLVGPTLPVTRVTGVNAHDQAKVGPPNVILDGSEHAAALFPHFADFDGDGTTDLLVGVTDRLLVYRNRGTDDRPDYAPPVWFDEREPSGWIPGG
ncbi:MAG: VCBS repeat-containing protein [Gemmataceae bacterium]|nr:VCBS repeat-containing protein [Gemmataceae bacterium]